jgi:hypothetical protein
MRSEGFHQFLPICDICIADVNVTLSNVLQFEELLRNADDSHGLHQQAKAHATIVYYSSRMEAVSYPIGEFAKPADIQQAWREGNDGVANFMLQKITGSSPN